MTPDQAALIVPSGAFLIFFSVITLNVALAKRKMTEWKRYATLHFVASVATVSIRRSAALWMKRFDYKEADALRLAKFQSIAMWESIVGIFIFFAIASTYQKL